MGAEKAPPGTLLRAVQEMNESFRLFGEVIGKEFAPTMLRLSEALRPIAEMERRRRLRRWAFAGIALMLVCAALVWWLT